MKFAEDVITQGITESSFLNLGSQIQQEKEIKMLKLMMLSHIKYRQKLAIKKDEYEKLKIEEI